MQNFLTLAAVAATVGAGVMAGLLFAFSNFVMQALARTGPSAGMAAMQRMNETILNPLFLLVFAGTALVSVFLVIAGFGAAAAPARGWLLAGAVLYLVGVIGVTGLFNVPLNNTLAESSLETAHELWPDWVEHWLRWNHVRSLCAVAAVGCFAIGLLRLGQGVAPG